GTIILIYFLTKEISLAKDKDSKQLIWLPVLSMLCLATTQYFLKYASHAMTDVPFTFFFTLALYFYVRSWRNSLFLLASGIGIGLATLTRSPMGLFPLGILIFHLILSRRFKLLFSVYFIGCFLLTLAIPAIWYLQQYYLFGDLFINRHFANIIGHSATTQARSSAQQFLWYFEYIFLIVKSYFPWFPLMFYGLFLTIRNLKREKNTDSEILLIVWFLVVLIPFSLADSKVLRYILPVFPALAIFSAYSMITLISPKYLLKLSQAVVLLLAIAAFIIVGFPNYLLRAEDMHQLSSISDAATEPNEKVVLFTSGELHWNYQNQLLWYGNRNTILIKDIKEIESLLSDKKQLTTIMDKTTFANLVKQTDFRIISLGESKKFVCFLVSIKPN
ncbi:MAG TPA: glycosyltransferase family 39 protein, partial [Pyrinomonadaceae bacterium]|nr:glycosyltransferase family 39 protein [Pyrinomonadaceae bacterium]